jgi:hypothetical protein
MFMKYLNVDSNDLKSGVAKISHLINQPKYQWLNYCSGLSNQAVLPLHKCYTLLG